MEEHLKSVTRIARIVPEKKVNRSIRAGDDEQTRLEGVNEALLNALVTIGTMFGMFEQVTLHDIEVASSYITLNAIEKYMGWKTGDSNNGMYMFAVLTKDGETPSIVVRVDMRTEHISGIFDLDVIGDVKIVTARIADSNIDIHDGERIPPWFNVELFNVLTNIAVVHPEIGKHVNGYYHNNVIVSITRDGIPPFYNALFYAMAMNIADNRHQNQSQSGMFYYAIDGDIIWFGQRETNGLWIVPYASYFISNPNRGILKYEGNVDTIAEILIHDWNPLCSLSILPYATNGHMFVA
jgi:hypothetical protein